MDYDEWVVAKHLLDAQLAFTLDYQLDDMSAQLDNAITSFINTWKEWIAVRGATERRERLLLGGDYSYTVIDFREDKLSKLLSMWGRLGVKNNESWVLWAFAPSKVALMTATEVNRGHPLIHQKPIIDWPLYYVVTNETPQKIELDSISTWNRATDKIGINWPLALGWDHWEDITEESDDSLLLTPTGGVFLPSDDISNYKIAGKKDYMNEGALESKGFTEEQFEIGALEGLFHFLSGWRAFDVLDTDMVTLEGDKISIDDFPSISSYSGAAMGKSSLILRNLISQDLKPVARQEASNEIIYSTVTPVFAIILSKDKPPPFSTLNWAEHNFISLLRYKCNEVK